MQKEWNCNNKCKLSCCEEIFLPMPNQIKKLFNEHNFWVVNAGYCDWKWLKLHKAIKIEKLFGGHRKLSINEGFSFEFKFNSYRGYEELYIKNKCEMLLSDKKCQIFRNRPEICKIAECPVFSSKKEIQYYAINGTLKEVYDEIQKSNQM